METSLSVDNMPPPVEGRMPTAAEMELKKRSGMLYAHDVWVICNEFQSKSDYTCRTDLPGIVNTLYAEMRGLGYEFEDASDRFNDVTHALHLTMTYTQLVHEARTEKKMFIIRRTPENCGALLMQQRLEHLNGHCSEWSPLAYIALVRDIHIVVTRDRVADQASTEQLLLAMARDGREPDDDTEKEEAAAGPPRVPNMPAALFKQQMSAMEQMLEAMKVSAAEVAEEAVAEEAVAEELESVVTEPPQKCLLQAPAAHPPPLSMYEMEMLTDEAMVAAWRRSA